VNPLLRTFVSPDAQVRLKVILLNDAGLWEGLLQRAADWQGACPQTKTTAGAVNLFGATPQPDCRRIGSNPAGPQPES
jgi:hypothetical protein